MSEQRIEYRVCWSASSDYNFRGESEWSLAGPGESAEAVEESLSSGSGVMADGLVEAIEASGFSWHVETRPAEGS